MQDAIKRSGTVQAVLKDLRRDIILKKLHDGTQVTELQFSEKYQCSRAALRGAITVLEHEGLVRIMPNGTKWICSLTTEDINNLYELRTYVECSAVKQALKKGIINASGLLKIIEEVEGGSDFLDCDARFHETLIDMSGNKALMQMWKTFIPVTRELFALNSSHSVSVREAFQERHMLITKMLMNKDEKVVEMLETHINEARELSLEE